MAGFQTLKHTRVDKPPGRGADPFTESLPALERGDVRNYDFAAIRRGTLRRDSPAYDQEETTLRLDTPKVKLSACNTAYRVVWLCDRRR